MIDRIIEKEEEKGERNVCIHTSRHTSRLYLYMYARKAFASKIYVR
jgi:hypothetical protein